MRQAFLSVFVWRSAVKNGTHTLDALQDFFKDGG